MTDTTIGDRIARTLCEAADLRDHRSAMAALLDIHSLHLAPLDTLGGAERWQHHPRVAALKTQLEHRLRQRLPDEPAPSGFPSPDGSGGGASGASRAGAADRVRQIAHEEMVPAVYEWLAESATLEGLVEFVSLEGGPDADFDDLVAICQVGLAGRPKLTLATNYWDELGRGSLDAVHTELHRGMASALGVRAVPLDELPVEALERKALNGYLATNRARQPEMIGSLGLIECQAGPRCRRVIAAMQRLAVPEGALPFYEEHATADPRHAKDWLDGVVAPLEEAHPGWGPRIVLGAQWRAAVNRRFFAAMESRFGGGRRAA